MAVLHLVASPKAQASTATRVAEAFLDAYVALHPNNTISTFDLWNTELPPVDEDLVTAKLAPLLGEPTTAAQDEAWVEVVALVDHFKSHDKIVISAPMWNFSIPYRLKHYIDLLVQPGLSFGLDDSFEHIGLLEDRPVQLIISRSSTFPVDSPDDFQLPYLRHVLGFIGLTDVRALLVEGTTIPDDAREEFLTRHCARARREASNF
ncbi:MAG: NAD(P)H-dependent oxidoreductase [Acidimicrobiales bacterium]